MDLMGYKNATFIRYVKLKKKFQKNIGFPLNIMRCLYFIIDVV